MAALTTEAAVAGYLETVSLLPYDLKYCTVGALTGGTANYVYLITPNPSSTTTGSPLVLKHSQPFVAAAPHITFSIDRQGFEARALKILPTILPSNQQHVQTPFILLHDPTHTALIFSSGGPRTLKAAYEDTALEIATVGRRLGKWLAALHARTRIPAVASALIGDSSTARNMYRFSYGKVASSLQKYGFDGKLGDQINERYGVLLATDDDCQCHGDFWPGNIIVAEDAKAAHGGGGIFPLTVVDWEMTRRGCGATDVGQFCAEAWLLDHFRGGRGLAAAFLQGYFGALAVTDQEDRNKVSRTDLTVEEVLALAGSRFLERMGVHLGTHLAFWTTRVKWAGEAETREVVRIGRDIITHAMEGRYRNWLEMFLMSG